MLHTFNASERCFCVSLQLCWCWVRVEVAVASPHRHDCYDPPTFCSTCPLHCYGSRRRNIHTQWKLITHYVEMAFKLKAHLKSTMNWSKRICMNIFLLHRGVVWCAHWSVSRLVSAPKGSGCLLTTPLRLASHRTTSRPAVTSHHEWLPLWREWSLLMYWIISTI